MQRSRAVPGVGFSNLMPCGLQEQPAEIPTAVGDEVANAIWRSWRLSFPGIGAVGLVRVGEALQAHVVPQEQAPWLTSEPPVRSLLQHDVGFSSEQQANLSLAAQQDLAPTFKQHWESVIRFRAGELLSAQPQFAAGKDWTRSITSSIQAPTCMIALDACVRKGLTSRLTLEFDDSRLLASFRQPTAAT